MTCFQVIIYQYVDCFVGLIMSNYRQTSNQIKSRVQKHCKEMSMVKNSYISNHKMTNLRTDEMVFICN